MGRVVLLLALLMFFSCTSYSGEQSGGGSEIASIIVSDGTISGKGAPYATVSLFTSQEVPGQNTVALKEVTIGSDSLFSLGQIAGEQISLLCINRRKGSGFVLPALSLQKDTTMELFYGEMKPLSGVIRLDSLDIPNERPPVQVSIPGTNYITYTDPSGAFSFEGLPWGTVQLDVRFYLGNSSVSDLTQEMIDAHVTDTIQIGISNGTNADVVEPDTVELFLK